ncbi:ATP-dependent zinc protease [Candidatus Woesearchaeota archaeon]|nr:ATP-dependent zinc protease [Candidatus Woesearchaeota archaeon]
MEKTVIGLVEHVTIHGEENEVKTEARIDTGATKSSIDMKLASKLKLGPIVSSKYIKSAHGSKLRPVIEAEITIKGRKIKSLFTLADREHMKFQVLVGQNILKDGFIIDPSL